MVDFAKLAAPFDPAKVSWRVGQVTKVDPKKASALCYIDARDVMERLDAVCGPDGWEDSYTETAKGRLICTIRIRVQRGGGMAAMQAGASAVDTWVSKSDGAGDTAVEGEKGAISDSFKRCAVKWGIGRYLYDIPIQWVAINQYKQIEKHEYAKLERALPGSRVASCDDDTPATQTPKPSPADFWKRDSYNLPAKTINEWTDRFCNACGAAPTQISIDKLIADNHAMWDGALKDSKLAARIKDAVDGRRDYIANPPRQAAE